MFNDNYNKPFMTIRETARTTGLSENYLRNLRKQGRLPGVECGVAYKVNVPDLIAQLSNKKRCADE